MKIQRSLLILLGIIGYWILFRYTAATEASLLPLLIAPLQDKHLSHWATQHIWPLLLILFAGLIWLYQNIVSSSQTPDAGGGKSQSDIAFSKKVSGNIVFSIFIITVLFRIVAVDGYPVGFPQHTVAIFEKDHRLFLSAIEKLVSLEAPVTALSDLCGLVVSKHLGLLWLLESLFYSLAAPSTSIAHFLPTLLGIVSVLLIIRAVDEGLGRSQAVLVGAALSVSPWHLAFSRYPDLCLINCIAHYSLMLFCLVRLLKNPSRLTGLIFGSSLGLGMYIYAPSQLMSLAMIPIVLIIFRSTLSLRIRGIACGSFIIASAPMIIHHWSKGRLLPVQTPVNNHAGYQLEFLANFRRLESLWNNIQYQAVGSWYNSDFGVFTPLDSVLFPASLVFAAWTCFRVAKKLWKREPLLVSEALLITVILQMFIGFLPTFLNQERTVRRIMISLGSILILNSFIMSRGLALLRNRIQKILMLSIVALQVVTGPILYFSRVHSYEVEKSADLKTVSTFFINEPRRSMICYKGASQKHLQNMAFFLNFQLYSRSDERAATSSLDYFQTSSARFIVGEESQCIQWLSSNPRGLQRVYLLLPDESSPSQKLIDEIETNLGATNQYSVPPFSPLRQVFRWDIPSEMR